jgi:hypothetical protein
MRPNYPQITRDLSFYRLQLNDYPADVKQLSELERDLRKKIEQYELLARPDDCPQVFRRLELTLDSSTKVAPAAWWRFWRPIIRAGICDLETLRRGYVNRLGALDGERHQSPDWWRGSR